MALKRMFSAEVVNTDKFKTMPPTAQNLYFHLGMCADDDGLVGNAVITMRSIDSKAKDLTALVDNGYIHKFKSGIVVILDWKVNNTIQKDRYKETMYTEEKAQLQTASNKRYILETECIQNGNALETQYRLDKISIDKDSIGEGSLDADKPPRTRSYGEYSWIKLTDEQYAKLVTDLGQAELDRCIRYIDESAQSTGNKNKWRDWNLVIRKCSRDGWGASVSIKSKDVYSPDKYVNGESFLDFMED